MKSKFLLPAYAASKLLGFDSILPISVYEELIKFCIVSHSSFLSSELSRCDLFPSHDSRFNINEVIRGKKSKLVLRHRVPFSFPSYMLMLFFMRKFSSIFFIILYLRKSHRHHNNKRKFFFGKKLLNLFHANKLCFCRK